MSKKPAGKGKKSKKPVKSKKPSVNVFDLFLPVLVVAAFALVGYLLFYRTGAPRQTHRAPQATLPRAAVKPAPEKAAPPAARRLARVAIIIDDMGNDQRALDAVIGLDAPVALAVLPGLKLSAETAKMAEKAGREVLLHLPMQPKGASMKGLGPGALMDGMSDEEISRTVMQDLKSVPGAVGVNNHMGSSMTEEEGPMVTVMDVMRRRGLFFVDSRTTASSTVLVAARENGVRACARDVFLDDSPDPAEIKRQFERMVALALKNGEAVAIGHPRPATLAVLKEELPGLKEKGVEVVKIGSLVK